MSNKRISDSGKRIRIVMALCGMKLPAFAEKYKISFSHLYAIENGRRPLNQKTAERIADAVRQEGFVCTAPWLLEGTGIEPYKKDTSSHNTKERDRILEALSPELKVMEEADFFRKLYKDSIISTVLDDGMDPTYALGDYVGGIFVSSFEEALGKECIVITEGDEQLVRRLIQGKHQGLYTLQCTNPKTTQPLLLDLPLKRAAPIVWHRRKPC